ncbi:MAG: 2-C-methyl-D-erythritol 4-phosphate cytidylyltransferase [candidate division WOR-3 bacterium]|uniref:2-C-methyl-D-erythritol 4-phosphate cytidylyltransferase n=2 Tax=candidate division WOR-3 bacterium TaxID=2052148 RepID=A0A7C3F1Q6_UNCW3|nr:2-C-methyl-D-erythritol 4-phosphate cytidylyltransferase [candidate division WOR-3 bacterium]
MVKSEGSGYGIILASGRGRRFGGLKQFALLRGRPVIYYSLRVFERCAAIQGYVVVTNPSKIRQVRKMVAELRLRKVLDVVWGGRERMDSVILGLAVLPEDGYVAVHDAARPLITVPMLTRGLKAVRKTGAVAFGAPVTDTIKEVIEGRIVRTVDRSGLVAIQTPQFFDLGILRRGYAKGSNQGMLITDDCQAVELLGLSPAVIINTRPNLKVTYPEDLRLCEALL